MISRKNIKHLIIHGLGVEGRAALTWFVETEIAAITVIDTAQKFSLLPDALTRDSRLKHSTEEDFDCGLADHSQTLYLRSPGISPSNAVFEEIKRQGILHTTPTGYWICELAPVHTITVTGTKGKSTTTSLIAHILRWAGKKALELGNIGRTPFEVKVDDQTICIVEVSSYMMHDLPPSAHFHAVTNLYKEHTDWHGSITAYHKDKLRPFNQYQPAPGIVPRAQEGAILNDSPKLQYYEDIACVVDSNIKIKNNEISINAGLLNDAFIAPSMVLALRAAIAICLASGLLCPEETVNAVKGNLGKWPGLPSRQTIVSSTDGIIWVDDALATVPEATISALTRWQGSPIHLLLGGNDRGQDFTHLINLCAANAHIRLYAFSQTAPRIASQVRKSAAASRCQTFETFEEMVGAAKSGAQQGEVILFSPAAPSAPPHANFAERSAIFTSFVPKN